AVRAGLALASQLETRARVDAGRDLEAQLMRPLLDAGAATRLTRIGDDGSLPVAVSARLGDREEPLLEAHLTRAAPLRAGLRRRPGLGATSFARPARRESRDGDGLLGAKGSLDELELQLVAQVLATARACPAGPSAAGAEEVPEQVADDVFEAGSEVEAGA